MPPSSPSRETYWRAVRRWTLGLLLIWAAVTFGVAYQARTLDFSWFGWPFSFWVAAQGAPLLYFAIVGLYAWATRRLDEAHDVDELD